MAYIGSFNAEEVKPASDFSALPAGEYHVIISASEMKPTSKGGEMLVLTLQVIEGPHKDRYLWPRLNLKNANEKTVEIAQRELSAICHATGVMQLSDSCQLHDKPMTVKVAYVPPKGEYGESNEVKAWKAYGSSPAAAFKTVPAAVATPKAAPRTPPVAPSAPAAPAGMPPWKKPPAAPVAEPIDDDVAF